MVLVRSQGCILFSLYHVEDLDGQAKGNVGHLECQVRRAKARVA